MAGAGVAAAWWAGMLPPNAALPLFGVAIVAGWVDAIAGGGGMLTLPALLSAGLPPAQALATNKLQGTFGALSSSLVFLRRGKVRLVQILPAVLVCALAAALGARCARAIDAQVLRHLIPLVLLAVAGWLLLRPGLGETAGAARVSWITWTLLAVPAIGFYDGLLGPGTGTFLAVAAISLRGMTATQATAQAKWLNLGSNLGALTMFLLAHQVRWWPGLTMAAGQIIGARLGAGIVLERGAAIVRPLVIVVALALCARLLLLG